MDVRLLCTRATVLAPARIPDSKPFAYHVGKPSTQWQPRGAADLGIEQSCGEGANVLHPQRPGSPSPERRQGAARVSGTWSANRGPDPWRTLAMLGAGRLLLPAGALAAALALTVRHPSAVALVGACTLWLLWPLLSIRSTTPARGVAGTFRLKVRYLGGHPACPDSGRGLLTVWPADAAATLRVGRRLVAFPLAAVRSVALADGRIEIGAGTRAWLAGLWGRLVARGVGRYCGLRRSAEGHVVLVDRSRVVCEILRTTGPCRIILVGPRGGGEEIYLEALVLLRSREAGNGAGTPGGARGESAVGGQ